MPFVPSKFPSGYCTDSVDVMMAWLDCSKRSGYIVPTERCRYCSGYTDGVCLFADKSDVFAYCRSNAKMLSRSTVLGRLRFWLHLRLAKLNEDWSAFEWLNSFQPCLGCGNYIGTCVNGRCLESFRLRRFKACLRRARKTILVGDYC